MIKMNIFKKPEIDSQTRDIVVITEESKGLVMLAMKLT